MCPWNMALGPKRVFSFWMAWQNQHVNFFTPLYYYLVHYRYKKLPDGASVEDKGDQEVNPYRGVLRYPEAVLSDATEFGCKHSIQSEGKLKFF